METRALLEMLERLELRSDLAELARVAPWVETLAGRYAIPEKTAFAINLCMEEALSNIVRHGYKGTCEQSIVIDFRISAGELIFVIEDRAPHFQPADMGIPLPDSLEEMTPGGLGIPLMRRFANRVEWEPLPDGNRLSLVFLFQP
jgi:anti-sigma regulatory factor (Ser/Thr protein kinase)